MPFSWLWSRRRPLSPRQPARRQTRFRPTVTALEDRTVPTGLIGSLLHGPFPIFPGPIHNPPPISGSATHLQVITPETVQAGNTFSVTVKAEDASNHVATGYTGTIAFTSNDTTALAAQSPGGTLTALSSFTYNFTSQDHGVHVFQFSVSPTGTLPVTDTISAADQATSSTITSNTASTLVTPAPTLAQLVVVTPEQAVTGTPTNVTVEALDSSGHLLKNFTGTVTLSTSDAAATGLPTNPPTYTFTASDHGRHTFQVTFGTVDTGSPVVPTTVTATDDAISGTGSVTVYAATTVTHFAIWTLPLALTGNADQVIVKALNAANQVVTGYTGGASFSLTSSTDTTATGLTTPTQDFTNGVAKFSVTFDATGLQTLTAADSSLDATGTAMVYVFAPPHHHPWPPIGPIGPIGGPIPYA